MIPSFHPEMLRDPAYKERIETLLGKIHSVRKAHTYIGYTGNRSLLQELETAYLENQDHYEKDYLINLQEYQQLVSEIADQREHLGTETYRELTSGFALIEEKLAAKEYATNREAGTLITQLRFDLHSSLAALQAQQQALGRLREELKSLMTQVWAEDYAQLKAQYQALKAPGKPISSASFLDPESTDTFRQARQGEVEALKLTLKGRKKLLRQVSALEGKYLHRTDFLALKRRLIRRMHLRRGLQILAGVLFLALLLGSLLVYPYVRKIYAEQEVWQQALSIDNWEGYEHYLEQYPNGKFTPLAKEKMLLLPYGKLKGFVGPNGNTFDYEGELDAGSPQGQGSALFEDSARYDGGWRGGAPFGQGVMSYPNGSSYSGEWQAGLRHGSGTFSSAQGETYSGEWKYDKRHGEGTLLYTDGSKYLGQWENDYPEGQGTFLAGESSTQARPGWEPGSSYLGQWHEGLRHGTGTYKWSDGRIYQGKWIQGQPDGKGTLLWPDGSSFRGEWKTGQIDGPGTFLSRLREEEKGIWKGSPEAVRLYNEDTVLVKQGRWENGLFIGSTGF